MNRPPTESTPSGATPSAPPLPPVASTREAIVAIALMVALAVAFAVFDGARAPIRAVARVAVPALVLIAAGRWLWRWMRARPAVAARLGVLLSFGTALAGWLDVALSGAARGLSHGGFAFLVVGPLAFALTLIAVLAGLAGAAAGALAAWTAARRPVPRRILLVAGGAAGALLNLGHIVRLAQVWTRG